MRRKREADGDEPALQTEASTSELAELRTELANLRLLVRRQDEVVERLLTAGAATSKGLGGHEAATNASGEKRTTRRRVLTQLAAGVAAAALYGSTRTETAGADYVGTDAGAGTSSHGIRAYPPGVTPVSYSRIAGVLGQRDTNAPGPILDAGVIGVGKDYVGVHGVSTAYNGVDGRTYSGASTDAGVLGFSLNAASAGVRGEHASSGGIGIRGVSDNGATAKGVYGTSVNGVGVWGHSVAGVGLKGTSQGFVGLVGISDTSIGLYGYTQAPGQPAFYAENLASSNRMAGLFNGNVRVDGNFTVTGAKNAAVKLSDGSEALVYCQESPEPYFEDFGRAQLMGGSLRVILEPQFADLVRRDSYMVFLTAESDCNGLYVSRRDANGFEVRELKAGTSTLPFTYRVVARRKDVPGERLKRVEPHETSGVAKVQKTLREKGISSTPQPEGPANPRRQEGPNGAGGSR